MVNDEANKIAHLTRSVTGADNKKETRSQSGSHWLLVQSLVEERSSLELVNIRAWEAHSHFPL
jgi:hypothetical protein